MERSPNSGEYGLLGRTLEECRGENLKGVIEGWIALRIKLGLQIPTINGCSIDSP